MSTTYELGISSETAITLYPEYDMKNGEKQIRNEHRSKSGKLRLYKWGDYNKISFSLNWVPAADAAIVNSWWDSNTELLFLVTSDTETQVYSVMILNTDTPLSEYNAPYRDYCKGKVQLEGY